MKSKRINWAKLVYRARNQTFPEANEERPLGRPKQRCIDKV